MKPPPEPPDLSALPPHVRREVEVWQQLLKHAIGCRPLRPVLARIAASRHVGLATAYRKYHAFSQKGWCGLVNRAKFPMPPVPSAPPHTFREFLHGLWLANKRSYRATHEQIVAMWKGGAKIPGFDERPKRGSFNTHPDGWTYANFVYHIKQVEANWPSDTKSSKSCGPRPPTQK